MSTTGKKLLGRTAWASMVLLIGLSLQSARAENPPTTLATLLDRAQIEDMIIEYYGLLGSGKRVYGSYYTEDGVLDVNGTISQGKKIIDDLYAKLEQPGSFPRGVFRMVLTNPRIVVNGESATADMIWTGIINDNIKAPPRLVEQGLEHDELVKQNGKWLFKHRYITADSNMPSMFDKTYKPRNVGH